MKTTTGKTTATVPPTTAGIATETANRKAGNKILYAMGLAVCLSLSGCSVGEPQKVLVTEVPPSDWSVVHPADVFYENTDTLGSKTLSVLIRFRNDFFCDRFDFILETLSPDKLIWRDTLSVPFRKEEVSEAVSLTYTDVRAPYRERSQLLREGRYRFRFIPLREDTCSGRVIGVGIEIIPGFRADGPAG